MRRAITCQPWYADGFMGDLSAICQTCGYDEFIKLPVSWLFIKYHSIPVGHCIYCWGDVRADMRGAQSFGSLRMPHPSTL